MDRLEMLKQLVSQNPADSFARYGLAMEYAKAGEYVEALAQHQAIIGDNPDYTAAYFQGGQVLERLGRLDEARRFYQRGVEVTTRLGDGHAREEMAAALGRLS